MWTHLQALSSFLPPVNCGVTVTYHFCIQHCFSVSIDRSTCLFIFVPTYHNTTLNSFLVSCKSFQALLLHFFFLFARLKMFCLSWAVHFHLI